MKLFYKLIALLLIAALVAPMLIKGPDGRPIMSWRDWVPDIDALKKSITKTITKLPADTSQTPARDTTKIYRWQDKQGTWHYSNTPTDSQQQTEEIKIGSTNEFSMDEATPNIEPLATPSNSSSTKQVQMPDGLSLKDVPNVLENARNVQHLMDERNNKLQKEIENH